MKQEKKTRKILMLIFIILMLLLLLTYFVVGIIYNSGNFSITLDGNLYFEKGLIIYDDFNYKVYRTELYAESPKTFDNILIRSQILSPSFFSPSIFFREQDKRRG